MNRRDFIKSLGISAVVTPVAKAFSLSGILSALSTKLLRKLEKRKVYNSYRDIFSRLDCPPVRFWLVSNGEIIPLSNDSPFDGVNDWIPMPQFQGDRGSCFGFIPRLGKPTYSPDEITVTLEVKD